MFRRDGERVLTISKTESQGKKKTGNGVFISKKNNTHPPPPTKNKNKKKKKHESKQTVLIIEVRYRMLIL